MVPAVADHTLDLIATLIVNGQRALPTTGMRFSPTGRQTTIF